MLNQRSWLLGLPKISITSATNEFDLRRNKRGLITMESIECAVRDHQPGDLRADKVNFHFKLIQNHLLKQVRKTPPAMIRVDIIRRRFKMFYRYIFSSPPFSTVLKASDVISTGFLFRACQLNPSQSKVAEVTVFEQAAIYQAQKQTQ